MIDIVETTIPVEKLYEELYDESCGGIVTFEGRVRDHSDGKQITKLFYECYYPMALKVMNEISDKAKRKWDIKQLVAVHRIREVQIGEIAVWIGVASVHRKEAFEACQFMINEIKSKVPIWKKEIYSNGDSCWVGCQMVHHNHLQGMKFCF